MKKIILFNLTCTVLLLLQSCGSQSDWVAETVDETHYVQGDIECSGDNTAISVDSDNMPVISYVDMCSDVVKYAYKRSLEWQNENAAHGKSILQTSFSLDSSSRPHICYSDYYYFTLNYVYRDASGWQQEIVDTDNFGIMGPSITVDKLNHVHIAYIFCSSSEERYFKYALRDETGWHLETVDNSTSIYLGMDIALDTDTMPHVLYYDNSYKILKHAWANAAGWQNETVAFNISEGPYPQFAIDSNNVLHVTFLDNTKEELRYCFKDASGWHMETVVSHGTSQAPVAIDSKNRPHLAYSTNEGITYGYRDSSGWQIEEVPIAGNTIDFALDANDIPHISCIEGKYDMVKYVYRKKSIYE